MSRSGRREKTEAQLRALEEHFRADLIQALHDCAGGVWGMFGTNDSLAGESQLLWSICRKTAEKLIEQREAITKLRNALGYTEPYPLFERYLECRQMRGANSSGEPKLAVHLLREIGVEVRLDSE